MTTPTFYLMDQAPDGSTEILQYTGLELCEIFSEAQRELLEAGERIIHHWPRGNHNHVIVDMAVAARTLLAS